MRKRLRRHFITGEWEEVEFETESGRVVYVYGEDEKPIKQAAIRSDKPWTSSTIAAGSKKEAAIFNEQLRKAGVLGEAYYDPKRQGRLVCYSRVARNKALGLRGFGDGSAGYGDRPPGG